ncbi:MAG: helix-turn-helix domain-containing protein [Bacteroidales bacterium]|nr:helix-turn-helix domain-containing protein [Bacteroidales bacterium]
MEKFVIKKLLKQRGMTFQQLADQLGVHRVNLSSSLAGNPTLSRLEEIAKLLDVEVMDLFAKSTQGEMTGYLEYKGEIYKISSIADVEKVMKKAKEKVE